MADLSRIGVVFAVILAAACAAVLALRWLARLPAAEPKAPLGKGLHAGVGAGALLALLAALALLAPFAAKYTHGPGMALALQLGAGGAAALLCLQRMVLRPLWLVFAILAAHGLEFALGPAILARNGASAHAIYVLGVGTLAGVAGWRAAQAGVANATGASLFGLLLAGLCAVAAIFTSGHAPAALAALLALAAGAAVLGLLQPRLALAAPVLALAAIAVIRLWPSPPGLLLDLQALSVAAGLALITSLTGLALILTRRAERVGALLAGFGPLLAVLAATPPGSGGLAHPWWALAALVAAIQTSLAFYSAEGLPGPRRILALGGACALLSGLALAGLGSWAVPAAACGLGLAWWSGRRGGAGLDLAAAAPALAAIAGGLAALARPDAGSATDVIVAADAAGGALLMLLAVRTLQAGIGRKACEMAGVVLSVTALLALANAAVLLLAPRAEAGLYRTGAHCLVLIAAAVALAHSPRGWLSPETRRFAENVILAGAGVYVLLATLSVLNPWWGMSPQPVRGPWVFNSLFAGYLGPALAFGLYARLLPQARPPLKRRWTEGMAALLALLWGVLETRRLVAGPDLAGGAAAWSPQTLLVAGVVLTIAVVLAAAALGAPQPGRLAFARVSERLARAASRSTDPNLSPPA